MAYRRIYPRSNEFSRCRRLFCFVKWNLTKHSEFMEYFAGLFDAEGYVSLSSSGHFQIAIEMTSEKICYDLQKEFDGKVYSRKRGSRKKTWHWIIGTNREPALSFIKKIAPLSKIKKTQLLRLQDYLESTRSFRKEIRKECVKQLSSLKKPLPLTKEQIDVETNIFPTEPFFKWLAGFTDGDGNICVYEYKSPKGTIIFDSWIGIFNTHPEIILFVQERIKGSISHYKGSQFPVWKWVCSNKESKNFCNNILPHLRLKKEQMQLLLEFLSIKETKVREKSYSFDQINRIREIISKIKHLNSL